MVQHNHHDPYRTREPGDDDTRATGPNTIQCFPDDRQAMYRVTQNVGTIGVEVKLGSSGKSMAIADNETRPTTCSSQIRTPGLERSGAMIAKKF